MELQEQKQNSKPHPSEERPWLFKPGQSGNPKGRPKGKSVKERAKAMLAAMNEEEFENFLAGLDKKVIWEMAEGKPKQDTESKVEVTLPTPLLANVPSDDSSEESTSTQEED